MRLRTGVARGLGAVVLLAAALAGPSRRSPRNLGLDRQPPAVGEPGEPIVATLPTNKPTSTTTTDAAQAAPPAQAATTTTTTRSVLEVGPTYSGNRPPEVFRFDGARYETWRESMPSGSMVLVGHDPRLRVEVTFGRATAGRIAHGEVTVRSTVGRVGGVEVEYGDGLPRTIVDRTPHPGDYCADPEQVNETFPLEHAWRDPGSHTVRVTAWTRTCSPDEGYRSTNATAVEVDRGVTRSNGPQTPGISGGASVAFGDAISSAPPRGLWLRAGDADGFVDAVRVAWDDGRVDLLEWNLDRCRHWTTKTWPWSQVSIIAEREWDGDTWGDGEHTATVTVTSTGCDGRGRQTATEVVDVGEDRGEPASVP